MHVRPMTKEDNQAVMTLVKRSLEHLDLALPGTAYFDPHLDHLYNYYQTHTPGNYWVLEHEHTIIGGVGIALFSASESICELQKLYLYPEFQKSGLSHQLMLTALSFAKKHYRSCYLETHTDLKSACALYEKYGFESLGHPLNGSEHSAMNVWYLKNLSDTAL